MIPNFFFAPLWFHIHKHLPQTFGLCRHSEMWEHADSLLEGS